MLTAVEPFTRRSAALALVLASLSFASGLQAQYRWHVVRPDTVNSELHRATTAISCNGGDCVATEVVWSPGEGDSNVILISHDGGHSWTPAEGTYPQWKYRDPTAKWGLFFTAAQQIDSLNAVVGDGGYGDVLLTHDGGKSWHVDSTDRGVVHLLYFANVAEGIVQSPFGFFSSTVDSGRTWKKVVFSTGDGWGIACQAYGDSTFRVFSYPMSIFTTHNNWRTWDTTEIALNGPLVDTSFHQFHFLFSRGDTLAIEGWRWYPPANKHASLAMAMSTDFGETWRELDVPRENGNYFPIADPPIINWKHIVLAGKDSVGRIVQSFDGGAHWECDTVPLNTGVPHHSVYPICVTDSGRVLAGVVDDHTVQGSSSLAYLERVTSHVEDTEDPQLLTLFPNPSIATLSLPDPNPVDVYDAIGREHICAQERALLDVSRLPPGVYYVISSMYRARFVRR